MQRRHRKWGQTWLCQSLSSVAFFFFQAEDGIRDFHVTGVQTCALPISQRLQRRRGVQELRALVPPGRRWAEPRVGLLLDRELRRFRGRQGAVAVRVLLGARPGDRGDRSEERRAGKESRARWSRYQQHAT